MQHHPRMTFLLILVSLAMTAGLASASITYSTPCSVLMFPNTTGNAGSTCSATPDAGFFLNSLTITITDDYTGLQSGTPTVSYTGTLTQSSAVFSAPTFCNVTTSGSNSVPCSVTINPSSTVTGLNLASYTIQLTNAGNSVTGGAVTGASEVMTLSATEAPIGGTPEPATLGLVGGALLGLGMLRKKLVR
jgi:hypothetical protein